MLSSNFIQVEGRNIHYLSGGTKEKEVLLFLHGWPTAAYLWRNVMPALAEKYWVIAVDLPGFGKSEKQLEDSYSFRYYARILEGFVEQLGIEKVNLGVHDLGGPVGLYWMVQNMERFERLILLNTLVYPDFSWAVILFGLAGRMPLVRSWLSSPSGIRTAIRIGIQRKEVLTKEVIASYQAPFQEKMDRKVLLKAAQRLSIKGFQEIEAKLSQFNKPVQIIYGENDRILPKVKQTMERIQKDLPQAQIISFPECGHFLQEEVPEEIAAVLLQFMQSSGVS